jgi:hypothetical protein
MRQHRFFAKRWFLADFLEWNSLAPIIGHVGDREEALFKSGQVRFKDECIVGSISCSFARSLQVIA